MAKPKTARAPIAGVGNVEILPPLPVGARALADAETIGYGHIQEVDKAMFMKACEGNVQAARLVYMRVLGQGLKEPEEGNAPSLNELEAMLEALKKGETP